MCIPHLVEIDSGAFVVLRREPASTWKASDSEVTRQMLEALPPGRA